MIWKWNKCRITYPKLKLTNILKVEEHSFTTILLHIPVCVLVEKATNYFARGLFCSWLLAVGTNFPFLEKGTLSSLWRVMQRLAMEIIEIRFLTKYRYIKHFTLNEYNNKFKIIMLILLLAITEINCDSYCLTNVRYIHETIHAA